MAFTSTVVAEQVQSCWSALEASSSATWSSPGESIAYKSAQKCLAMAEPDSTQILDCLDIELCSFVDIDLLSVPSSPTAPSRPHSTVSIHSTANICGLMLPSTCTDMTESSAVSGQQADACRSALTDSSTLSDLSGFVCAMKCFDIAGTIGIAIVDCLQIELCSDMTQSCHLSKSPSASLSSAPASLVTATTTVTPASSATTSSTVPAISAADICDLTMAGVCTEMAGSSTVSSQQASACKSGLEISFPSVDLDECALKCLGATGAPGTAVIDCLYIELCAGLAVAQSSILPGSGGSSEPFSSAVVVGAIGITGNTASMTPAFAHSATMSEVQMSSTTSFMPVPPTSAGSKSGSPASVSSVSASGSPAHETLSSTINTIASSVIPALSTNSVNSDIYSAPLVSSSRVSGSAQSSDTCTSAASSTSSASAASASSTGSTTPVSSAIPINSAGSARATSLTHVATALVSKTASTPSISRPSDITKSSAGPSSFTTSYSGSSPIGSSPAKYTAAANNNSARSLCISGFFATLAVIFGYM
ncbi:uncharacterized protein M437DRAFT_88075 [Aureobasidium melanogenum CBS 110374]|uniref:Uncharacterized protein n=1 Tax=Aureobasidium melanogenum (strain CBS 110374) TaxID=1043003 RepID=A0A074W9E9_AURM1|nr:uncharacterized protein M437DRAFT_88075 [Aureobasidium melanogenum CBS 110374]KEQ59131.1 hypothetical protein M437DRAFT_88075 [Aureobasidium melanogenum CBS 110374]